MTSMVERQNKTADGLRDRLFDTLDALIDGNIDSEKVSGVCFISEQILKSAQLEFDIEIEREKSIKEKREFERESLQIAKQSISMLSDSIEASIEED